MTEQPPQGPALPPEVEVTVQPGRVVLADFQYQLSRQFDLEGGLTGLILTVWHPLLPVVQLSLPFTRLNAALFLRALQRALGESDNGDHPTGAG